jgi:hypothetical protein
MNLDVFDVSFGPLLRKPLAQISKMYNEGIFVDLIYVYSMHGYYYFSPIPRTLRNCTFIWSPF